MVSRHTFTHAKQLTLPLPRLDELYALYGLSGDQCYLPYTTDTASNLYRSRINSKNEYAFRLNHDDF